MAFEFEGVLAVGFVAIITNFCAEAGKDLWKHLKARRLRYGKLVKKARK